MTFVTERCVVRLLEGSLTVTEIAPGVDLERDILTRAGIPLSVAADLRVMDERLFHPRPMGLHLRDGSPRRSGLAASATERERSHVDH